MALQIVHVVAVESDELAHAHSSRIERFEHCAIARGLWSACRAIAVHGGLLQEALDFAGGYRTRCVFVDSGSRHARARIATQLTLADQEVEERFNGGHLAGNGRGCVLAVPKKE